jgi:internalin A
VRDVTKFLGAATALAICITTAAWAWCDENADSLEHGRINPCKVANDEIEQLIEDLSSDSSSVRTNAQRQLTDLGESALPPIARAFVDGNAEQQIRAREILLANPTNAALRQHKIAALDQILERGTTKEAAEHTVTVVLALEKAALKVVNTDHVAVGFHENGRVKSLQDKNDLDGERANLKDAQLLELATFSQLTHLDLSGEPFDDIYHTSPVTDAGLSHLQSLQRLEHLDLEGTQVTDAGLKQIATLSNLRSLSLNASKVTGKTIGELAKLRRLTSLNVGSSNVKDIAEIDRLEGLEELNVGDTDVTDRDLAVIARLSQLRSLDLSSESYAGKRSRITDSGMSSLSSLKHLQYLNLSHARISDAGLSCLREMKDLRTLNLYHASRITDAAFVHLEGLHHLELLQLEATGVAGAELSRLKEMKNLRRLSLRRVSAEGLRTLPPLPALEIFEASCHGSDPSLPNINASSNLARFRFHPISDGILEQLNGLTKLENIECGKEVTDRGLQAIGRIPGVRSVYLSESKITGDGLRSLEPLSKLERLTLYRTNVSNADLTPLSSLRSLRELTIWERTVSDEGLWHLSKMTRLKTIDFSGTILSAPAIARLRGQLPNTTIHSMPPLR